MALRQRRHQLSWHLVRLPIWLILLLGLVASLWYANTRRDDVMERAEVGFDAASAAQAASLSTALRRNVDLVASVSGFVAGSDDVSNAELASWFQAIGPSRYVGLTAVGYVARIPHDELDAIVARAGADPVPLTSSGPFDLLPAGERSEYCLVRLGVGGVGSTLHDVPRGLDLCALPDLGDALRSSAETGSIVQLPALNAPAEPADAGATADQLGLSPAERARLTGMQVDGTSIVVASPVYDEGPLLTPADRRGRHLGWAIVAYDARAMLLASLSGPLADFVSLSSRQPPAPSAAGGPDGVAAPDGADGSGPAASATLGVRPTGAAFVQSIDFEADGSWRATFVTSSTAVAAEADRRWAITLLQGAGVSVLAFLLLTVIVGSRQRALRLVDQRTGELRRQALHDALTGLPNRALILDRAERLLASCRRDGRRPAALFVDLDGFKAANDTLGHAAGDRLLQEVATRLSGVVREGDTVGRIGGDEFVVLTAVDPLGAGPQLVADRVLAALRAPFEAEGHGRAVTVTASVGIASGDRLAPEDLIRDADIALYEAKAAGKDRYAVYDSGMHDGARARVESGLDLRAALDASQLRLVFQPTFDLREVEVTGVEALLRWDHPVRGEIQPLDFLPLAEETGLILPIGRWVLAEACREGAAWHAGGHRIRVSVNVSARQLERDDFVDEVRTALEESGLEATSLVLEVTESTLMRDAAATAERLRRLKALGVLIAVDDFGTGYSSLSSLKQFPVDSLKIDRSFIAGIADARESSALIHTLVQLGKDLGIETLAEGIEEQDQFHRLRGEQCDSGQGFLFARPIDGSGVTAFLESWTASKASTGVLDGVDARQVVRSEIAVGRDPSRTGAGTGAAAGAAAKAAGYEAGAGEDGDTAEAEDVGSPA